MTAPRLLPFALVAALVAGCAEVNEGTGAELDRFPGLLISRGFDGERANNNSMYVSVSANGGRVTFSSGATNLVPDDDNKVCPFGGGLVVPLSEVNCADVFMWDRQTDRLQLLSRTPAGRPGDQDSVESVISGDGNRVAFYSFASDLHPADQDHYKDLYLHDVLTGRTDLVTKGDGRGGRNTRDTCQKWCGSASLSFDGRFVTFDSWREDLVLEDQNGLPDVFLFDHERDVMERISVGFDGSEANGPSWSSLWQSISHDGRFVVFNSGATNLIPPGSGAVDANRTQVYLWDAKNESIGLVSRSMDGDPIDADAGTPVISGDGRYIAFMTWATNIIAGDDNGKADVYLYDRLTGQTSLASVSSDGERGDGGSLSPSLSQDGSLLAFQSWAGNLAEGTYRDGLNLYLTATPRHETTVIDPASLPGTPRSSLFGVLSADGGTIAMITDAGDPNGHSQVFIQDFQTR